MKRPIRVKLRIAQGGIYRNCADVMGRFMSRRVKTRRYPKPKPTKGAKRSGVDILREKSVFFELQPRVTQGVFA